MPRIHLDNVCLSLPIRHSHSRELSDDAGTRDPRIVTDRFGKPRRFQVLNHLAFQIERGDRLAIIGRNGSGKSTLLRVLNGVYSPQVGTLEIEGSTDALFELNLGVKPQATGFQNIIFGGLMRGYTRAEVLERIDDIVEFTQLGDFLSMPLHTYSAGMRMRLLFALATTFEPEILLLDEWISAGDAAFRERANKRMQEQVERAGILVLASHSSRLLRANCNKALWLEHGRIVGFGNLDEVFANFDAAVQHGAREVPAPIPLERLKALMAPPALAAESSIQTPNPDRTRGRVRRHRRRHN